MKVADFGLSKHKFNSFVSCRDLRGTLPYMAPELVSNPNQVRFTTCMPGAVGFGLSAVVQSHGPDCHACPQSTATGVAKCDLLGFPFLVLNIFPWQGLAY